MWESLMYGKPLSFPTKNFILDSPDKAGYEWADINQDKKFF